MAGFGDAPAYSLACNKSQIAEIFSAILLHAFDTSDTAMRTLSERLASWSGFGDPSELGGWELGSTPCKTYPILTSKEGAARNGVDSALALLGTPTE